MADCAVIYGANGYTGRLIAERATSIGCNIVLAGRDPVKLQPLAHSLGLDWRCAHLDSPQDMDRMLVGATAVLHAAGPFTATARPMIEACLRAGVHYLDVAGELPVFQMAAHYDGQARDRGIMIMPGAGFAIVATDCVASHVKACMPTARHLRLGLSKPVGLSGGSIRTILGMVRGQVAICRNGQLTAVKIGRLQRSFDYGEGDRWSTCVNWPDTFTALLSTGIPNIEVYIEANFLDRWAYQMGGFFAAPLQLGTVQAVLNSSAMTKAVASLAMGPMPRQVVVGEAEDTWRQQARVTLTTVDGYNFTSLAAAEILRRVLRGDLQPGFQTPSQVYGADFALGLAGTRCETLSPHARSESCPSPHHIEG